MITTVKENSGNSGNVFTRERVFIDIPQSEMMFFQFFAEKMGWQINSKQRIWDEYMKSSPENIDLSEEEIMEAVRAVRYGKV